MCVNYPCSIYTIGKLQKQVIFSNYTVILIYPKPTIMKTVVHYFYFLQTKIYLLVLAALFSVNSFAQLQLAFTGTPALTGTAGTVGATYTFLNVGNTGSQTINAHVTIVSVYGGAVLADIDTESDGSNNALQPVITGSQSAGNCWGIKFAINFVDASTDLPILLNSFKCSGVDIDGDGGLMREFNTFYNPSTYILESPTDLAVTSNAGNIKFTAPQSEFPGILISETAVAVTCLYNKTSGLEIELGACCTTGACSASAGNVIHSINFFDPVTFTNAAVLPVKITSFSAAVQNGGTLLNWESATETNLALYTLQYSEDGSIFTDVNTVNAKGSNATYSYIDNAIRKAEINYYRLKLTDVNGRVSFSAILVVRDDKNLLHTISVSPNPFIKNLAISFTAATKQTVNFRLLNSEGKVIQSMRRQVVKGTNNFTMENNDASSGAGNIYWVIASGDKGVLATLKILKQ